MEKKENFSSRLGFILISAGCAIGIGNIYKFPIWTGAYGGGIFVAIYLAFLLLLGIPVMTCELAVGRASKASIASSFERLEKKGSKWHLWQYVGIIANYMLMMCYTVICGLFTVYFFKYMDGSITAAKTVAEASEIWGATFTSFQTNYLATMFVIIVCLAVCGFGLRNGVERITKVMMVILFLLLIGLSIYSLTLPGAKEGLSFYLVPSAEKAVEAGWTSVISHAMSQAFFTLSLGIGSIAIFGASIGKERRLLGETVTIVGLDTFVALMAGLFLFPAFFTFNPGGTIAAGDGNALFLFVTESVVFNNMAGGRIIGCLFFLLMVFACYSTVIAVMENIVNFWLEKTKLKRWTIVLINIGLFFILILPAIFAQCDTFGLGSFKILGMTMDGFEDWFVGNMCLPIGSLIYVLFCVTRYGWGWSNYFDEVNAGKGLAVPRWIKNYMKYVLPIIILVVVVMNFI